MSLLLKKLAPPQPAFVDSNSFAGAATVVAAVPTTRDPLPWWKRSVDLMACAALLPFLGLVTLVMYILTSLLAPGPVLFVQERVGHRGRRFQLFKFRTMYVNADRSVHNNHCKDLIGSNAPMTKLDARGDSRLFPFAWLLRASGLDELPQMINVLRGEMSLIGPRPCLPEEFDLYTPAQRRRCDVLPGLTGLWQVSGKNQTTFEEMIELDMRYGQTLSPWMDCKIVVLTAPSLLLQVLETRSARSAAKSAAAQPSTSHPFPPGTRSS